MTEETRKKLWQIVPLVLVIVAMALTAWVAHDVGNNLKEISKLEGFQESNRKHENRSE